MEGRIPFVLRIGVTGHRRMENGPALAPAVRDAVARVRRLVPVSDSTPVVPVVVSALAEGADRLVAREILTAPGARLEAALPLPPEDYARDFGSETSAQEFGELLGRSSEVWQAPESRDREEAYERAGRHVVDRCDVLIAVWDGRPSSGRGGTSQIVDYARERGVPLVWVPTEGEPRPVEELEGERAALVAEAGAELERFNRPSIPHRRARANVERELERLGAAAGGAQDPLAREPVARWLLPFFVRADLLALRFQSRFKVMSAAIFLMAAAAVGVVAVQTQLFPERTWLVAFEVAALLGVLAILGLSRRWGLHERWIAYRFLAERIRSLYFLALAGSGHSPDPRGSLAYLTDPSEVWIERALTEVMTRLPAAPRDPPVEPLREYLAAHWIGDQARYQGKAAAEHRARDTWLIRVTAVLFVTTLVASVLHLLGVGGHGEHGSTLGAVLVVLAIVVPVAGAAAHGIGTQRQFRRHSERYRRMAELLGQLHDEMRRARTLGEVRRAAAETERIIREENSDWFGVMRFHDIELIT